MLYTRPFLRLLSFSNSITSVRHASRTSHHAQGFALVQDKQAPSVASHNIKFSLASDVPAQCVQHIFRLNLAEITNANKLLNGSRPLLSFCKLLFKHDVYSIRLGAKNQLLNANNCKMYA